MDQQRSDQADHHHETHVAQHEPPPGQLEHVKRRIQPENGVRSTEVGGADPCQEDRHLTGGNSAAQQTSHGRGQQHEYPGTPVQVVAQLEQQLGIQIRAPHRGT